ncbi:MAG: helix-hairpin-helix domain-containing protein [Methanobacteriaceae archaeon]|nr:helix-hairpin-helix domain-containing protein [Methanobacteriaceae archaeon]
MSLSKDIQQLTDAAYYDRCNTISYNIDQLIKTINDSNDGIYYAKNGKCLVPLFKILQSNQCNSDCTYCTNCKKHKYQRASISPEALAKVYNQYYQEKKVEGLFLSSGIIKDADTTTEQMIKTAEILRNQYSYKGYIHLKIIPGTNKDYIKQAMQLADRVSINIESATQEGFEKLTTIKDYKIDVLRRLKWIDKLHTRDHHLAPAGHTTQIIVGANDETDNDILKTVYNLRKNYNIKENYFSNFTPIKNTPLEGHNAGKSIRTGRLYQAEHLFSSYNFKLDELHFEKDGNIALDEDPKFIAAENNPEKYPMDVNTASYKELIRVPGIGVKSARRIIHMRKQKKEIKHITDLKKIGANTRKCELFIKIKGSYQSHF